MPSVRHEAPLELLRYNPQLAAVLLRGLGVPVPAGTRAAMMSADLSASVPAEFRADAVVVLSGDGGARMAVVVEVQLRYDRRKRYSWPAYLTQVRAAQHCTAVLLVICAGTATAARCRTPIRTGHPGFDLAPLVIDSDTMPGPGTPGAAVAAPELAVLGVLTGALDLGQDSVRQLVLASMAGLEDSRLATYTVFVRSAASDLARQALEDLMTTKFRDDFVDRYLAEGEAKGRAEGEAKGEARIVLRILAVRGLQVPDNVREQVLACTDTSQLEAWADKAVTADSVDDVFGS
jgi:hypothetical protein